MSIWWPRIRKKPDSPGESPFSVRKSALRVKERWTNPRGAMDCPVVLWQYKNFFQGSDMYQRILVPIDGSATSNLALQEVSKLAKQHSTPVELVYVMADIHLMDANSYINYDEMKESLERTGRRIL